MTLRPPPGERSIPALLSFGVVNLDKPPGPSSHQIATWVNDLLSDALADEQGGNRSTEVSENGDRSTEISGVAHTGTLDPKVTGCLPLLLGEATRAAQVFADSHKEYVAVLELHGPIPADFEETLATFETEIYQKPPRKSAVRRKLRTREIFALKALEREDRRVLLRIECEAGTYVRKLCHDLGLALGTGAHMGDLRRTETGQFDDSTLVTMEDLTDALAFWVEDGEETPLREIVQPAEAALTTLPRITIAPSAAREVAHGAPVYAPGVIEAESAAVGGTDPVAGALVACYTPDGSAVCIGELVGDPQQESGTVVELERVLV